MSKERLVKVLHVDQQPGDDLEAGINEHLGNLHRDGKEILNVAYGYSVENSKEHFTALISYYD